MRFSEPAAPLPASTAAFRTMSRAGTLVRYTPWVVSTLVAVTLLMRFVMLGDRPVMHDESLFAYYAYVFFDTGRYTHMPILHGPTLMLATGALFAIFGDSVAVARAFIASASLVMLAAALVLVPRRCRLWIRAAADYLAGAALLQPLSAR